MAETWSVAQGTRLRRRVAIVDGDGAAIDYTDQPVPTAVVWAGDDQVPLGAPTVAWYDAAAGQADVTIPPALTALLDPGRYRLRLKTGDDEAFEATLRITASPGLAAAPHSYITRNDLTGYARWIDDLLDELEDQAGFAEQRALASRWLEDQALARRRAEALNVSRRWGEIGLIGTGIPTDEGEARAYFQDDRLLIDARTREIVARRTLYLILDDQLGSQGDTPYQVLAEKQRVRSVLLLSGWSARVDTTEPADGVANIELR